MLLGEVSSEGGSVADACGRGRDDAVSTLCQASVAGLDRTGRRIAGCTVCQWTSRCDQAVAHAAAPTRGAIVIRTMMTGYCPRSRELTALRSVRSRRCGPGLPRHACVRGCLRAGMQWRLVLGASRAVFKCGVYAVQQRQPPDSICDYHWVKGPKESHRRRHSALNYYRLLRNVGSRR